RRAGDRCARRKRVVGSWNQEPYSWELETGNWKLHRLQELLRLLFELAVFRRPLRIDRDRDHFLEQRLGFWLAALIDERLGEKIQRRGAVRVVGERLAEVLFGLLLAAAEQTRNLVVPPSEGAVG